MSSSKKSARPSSKVRKPVKSPKEKEKKENLWKNWLQQVSQTK